MKRTEHWNENFYAKDLRGKSFAGHFFYRCCFRAAVMDETTNLRAAAFENCNLSLMDAKGANFEKAVINYSDVSFSDFTGANFLFARMQWTAAKGARFDMADLRGVEADHSNFLNAKFEGAKLAGWSREIISEILRQQTDDQQVKMIAAWIGSEYQLCWDQFLTYTKNVYIAPKVDMIFSILRRFGFGELIDNGGLLCHRPEQGLPQEQSCQQSELQLLSARR